MIASIINNPPIPSVATILLPRDIIIPASKTPRATAEMLVLKSRFKKLAANVPVHAPVPGIGIPTNNNNAIKIPLFPADCFSFSPPLVPFSKHQVKNPPIIFLLLPHIKTLRAKKKMNGTGNIFPIMATIYDGNNGKS